MGLAMIGMIRGFAMLLACVALAGCDVGSNEFDVRVDRSAARIATPLLEASTADVEAVLPGLKVARSRPSPNEIRFVFPGSGKYEPASIVFRLDPTDDGKATLVHATVKVPPITAVVHGQTKVLSERKVAAELRSVIDAMAKGASDAETKKKFSLMLAGMAVATDDVLRNRALALASDQGAILREMLESTSGERPVDDGAVDKSDPTEYDTPRDGSEEFAPERENRHRLSYDDEVIEEPVGE